jgi:hypothetical protein
MLKGTAFFRPFARTALSVEMAAVARRIAGKAPGEITLEQARVRLEKDEDPNGPSRTISYQQCHKGN